MEIQLETQQFFSYYVNDMLCHNNWVEKELTAGGLVLSLFFIKSVKNQDLGQ